MTSNEQQLYIQGLMQRIAEIQKKKGDDYAGQDRLSNFKSTAAVLHIPLQKVVLTEVVKKCARLGNLVDGEKEPENESIEDSFDDLVSYAILAHMCNSEVKKGQ